MHEFEKIQVFKKCKCSENTIRVLKEYILLTTDSFNNMEKNAHIKTIHKTSFTCNHAGYYKEIINNTIMKLGLYKKKRFNKKKTDINKCSGVKLAHIVELYSNINKKHILLNSNKNATTKLVNLNSNKHVSLNKFSEDFDVTTKNKYIQLNEHYIFYKNNNVNTERLTMLHLLKKIDEIQISFS